MNLLLEILTGGVAGGTSILFAALGETISERAGVVNLGTEGSMLAGACTGYAVAAETGSPWVGALGGAVAGALLAAVLAYFVLSRGSNQLATGLVVLFLALGLTSLFGAAYVSQTITPFRAWDVPGCRTSPGSARCSSSRTPSPTSPTCWCRPSGGCCSGAVGACCCAAPVNAPRCSPPTATGSCPPSTLAVVMGGALAGVGGAQLSTAYANAWFENMIQGRGFIAVAVVIFANRKPFPVAAGALLFGTALALSPALQSRGYSINQFALHAIPYVARSWRPRGARPPPDRRHARGPQEGLRAVPMR